MLLINTMARNPGTQAVHKVSDRDCAPPLCKQAREVLPEKAVPPSYQLPEGMHMVLFKDKTIASTKDHAPLHRPPPKTEKELTSHSPLSNCRVQKRAISHNFMLPPAK
jgi:hypothetical protein